jgi:ABC-type transport system involved in multi-copper enzyme maturation permease subunit
MKAFAAVARREIVEKRFVLAAALVAAVIPFAVPIARGLSGETAREARDLTAALLAVGISLAAALGLGASVFAGEFAAKRMGFFLSRPISIGALWAGKLAGTLLLVAGTFGLIVGPSAILDRDRFTAGEAVVELGVSTAGLLMIFLLANAVSTIVRSRSTLAAADLVMAGVVSLVCASAFSALAGAGFDATDSLAIGGAAVLIASLLFASYRALASGRTDLRMAHRAFSSALWGVVVSASAVLAGYAVWALRAPPSAISRVFQAVPSGADGWVVIEGRARGLPAAFLYDLRSGRFHRFLSPVMETSSDGHVAVWLAADSARGPLTLTTLRLDDPHASERQTKILLPRGTGPLIVSADGSRVAAVSGRLLSVYEVSSGRLLASVQVQEKDDSISGTFVSPDVVRILRIRFGDEPGRTRGDVAELDVPSKQLSVVGRDDDLTGSAPVRRSPSGDVLLMKEGAGSRVTLRDARTLAVKAVLQQGKPRQSSAMFLADGTIAFGTSDKSASWAELFSSEGVSLVRVVLGGPGFVQFGGEPSAGQLLVTVFPDYDPGRSTRRLYLIDRQPGSAREIARGLEPLSLWWWEARSAAPGSELAKVFISEGRELVRLDPATGERRVLLGGR